jgi:hypothetical protein
VSNQNKKPEYLFRSEYVSNRLSDDEVQSAKKKLHQNGKSLTKKALTHVEILRMKLFIAISLKP